MESILSNIVISINDKLYVKNPETSELGKKIIEHSIVLIDEIGFENFTFKKLGERIQSNESSIYRYFESKHKLMLYLSSWYWSWIEYRIVLETNSLLDAKDKLHRALKIVTEQVLDDTTTLHVNEAILNKIIVSEFIKTLFTKEVDDENKEGFFKVYKRVINRIVVMITAVNPDYTYAKSLASSVVQGALHQHFLKEHLTTITNCNDTISPTDFYIDLIDKLLK